MGQFFGKYIGVQGVLATAFCAGYIIAPFAEVVLPAGYTEITLLFVGMYAQRNGGNIVARARSGP